MAAPGDLGELIAALRGKPLASSLPFVLGWTFLLFPSISSFGFRTLAPCECFDYIAAPVQAPIAKIRRRCASQAFPTAAHRASTADPSGAVAPAPTPPPAARVGSWALMEQPMAVWLLSFLIVGVLIGSLMSFALVIRQQALSASLKRENTLLSQRLNKDVKSG